ncbi:patatin-like phospholipase family protein [Pseudomonas gessardii]|uniref:patatin-like phospholipase family protein n=1 Tax=Pseudomonas gessardii TaxID=78544 RepID=UPI0018D957AE|nr:patatin-like phospholipase family protein [Pseudomonas gessardii]MBH3422467.1 patatin-like phospholipase family protein [Pseudomonas gessardii]
MLIPSSVNALAATGRPQEITPPKDQPPPKARLSTDPVGQGLTAALKSSIGVAVSAQLPDISRAALVAPQPEGASQLIAEGAGKRQVTLRSFENGVTEVKLTRPPLTGLVLSGGGAKGAAYPGAISALENKGALDGIKSISGSSAGAITAALLASGMSAGSFKSLSDSMDLISLLDSGKGWMKKLQHLNSGLGKLITFGNNGVVASIVRLLYNILPRMGSEAAPLEKVLRTESSKSVLNQIAAHPEVARQPAVNAIVQKLQKGGAVTFSDLSVLSRQIPQIKELNITGTAMYEGRPQLVVFNADLTPDMDIARAAHISGSFPLVFKQMGETNHPFQAENERTKFQDGGVMLNVPVAEMINQQFSNSPLRQDDNLILKFPEDAVPEKGPSQYRPSVFEWVVGAPLGAQAALQARGLAALEDQTVVVPLKTESGDYSGMLSGTLNFTMPDGVKNELQSLLHKEVGNHLDNRLQAREAHTFATMESALLALDDEMLASVSAQEPVRTADVVQFRRAATQAFSELTVAILSAKDMKLSDGINSALARLDTLASTPERKAWVANTLNNTDNTDHQRLLGALRNTPVESPVLKAAVDEMRRRDVAVIADNIRKEVILPSLYRVGQPASNVALLNRVEHSLMRAISPAQINQALDDLIDNYGARNKPWSKPSSSTTVEMAKAWRIAE